VITRLLVEIAMKSSFINSRPGAMGMNVGGRLRRRLEERPIDIMSRWKWWFALSLAVLAIAVAGLIGRGLNFGLDFTGGRLIEYATARPVDLDELRTELAASGFARPVVQESGDGNVSVRVGELSAGEEVEIAAVVESLGGTAEEVRDEFVGPTIGNELRRRATIALALGLGAQLLYLAVRFRWTYGTSAVIAIFHDVMILLGLFAWLQKDIDGVFVAALLTVIGYSINDSVVVFDRIRERRRVRIKVPLAVAANEACLSTIPRTINTGLGALFILVALYFLGGETLTDFAFALIVGILVGTYSSVFTAAPVAVALDRLSPAAVPATTSSTAVRQAAPRRPQPDDASPRPGATSPAAKSPTGAAPRRRAGAAKRKRRRKR